MVADVLRAMKRRWYIALIGLIGTVALGFVAGLASPPTYTARGLVLLLPSKEVVTNGGNPLLVMDGLDLPASILVAYYQSAEVQRAMAEAVPVPGATYEVSIEESTRGPMLAVDVSAPSAEGALSALGFVSESIPRNLESLQSDVDAPQKAVVTSMPLVMDTKASPDTSGSLRLRILAIVVGLVATAYLTSALDGLLLRRRLGRRREVDQGRGLRPAVDPDPRPHLEVEPERRFAR